MRKINFVYFGVVNAPNGAATFFRTLFKHRAHFEESGNCETEFYAQNMSVLNKAKDTPVSVSRSKKLRLLLQQYAFLYFVFSLLGLYVFCLRHALKVVKKIPIESGDSDSVYFFNDIFSAYYFLKKKGKRGRIVLVLHNDGEATKMLLGQFPKLTGTWVEKYINKSFLWMLSQCDDVVLLSQMSKDRFLFLYKSYLSQQRLHVIYNAADLISNLQQVSCVTSRKEMTGVSIGSISYRKGFDLLVNAVKSVKEVRSDFHIQFKCIGNIQNQDIVNNNAVDNIQFLGSLSHAEIVEYLLTADFFILCSRDEGMPISIIEAMQCHLPIFATNVGAIPEMFSSGVEGIIFEPTLANLIDVLNGITDGDYDLEQMGNAAFVKYQNCYSIEKMLDCYKKLLVHES
ncbi:glycosyltransferase family 4 protein [Bacteroides sp. KH569_7]|uniref:Glycosyltransferase family 4 protein n=1 Tax=Bacteroides muris (ex Fokt et al. 2023) TaxID=2937417 RepID=A0A9X2SVL5_9BACE|nr:glycosyltransferase family 4 protein [Bacteroides muris (ex Fokt et al. 2023)]MCR6508186.1 glycosyltransferase family 4 protein [Bacteroides muris (ex Fokt et al. 2023)]